MAREQCLTELFVELADTVVEQSKGVLSARAGISVSEGFPRMRTHAELRATADGGDASAPA